MIRLSVDDSSYLIPFFERLVTAPNKLETIDICWLQKANIDWGRFESILLHSSFARLRELKCVVFGLYGEEDVVGQPKGWYDDPNKGSSADLKMTQDIEDFEKKLSGLSSKGVLQPQPRWRFNRHGWTASRVVGRSSSGSTNSDTSTHGGDTD
ncbi:hypothetical protein PM082_018750 [Marasmius tenuissimus]|nr:hypothetical protein PM082_018750 [Marasmius tenuissimus]